MKIECPFKVGDRIRNVYSTELATVTEITEKGFKYKMDHPVCIHPFLGSYQEGECYSNGYDFYELLSPETPIQSLNEIQVHFQKGIGCSSV